MNINKLYEYTLFALKYTLLLILLKIFLLHSYNEKEKQNNLKRFQQTNINSKF